MFHDTNILMIMSMLSLVNFKNQFITAVFVDNFVLKFQNQNKSWFYLKKASLSLAKFSID